MPQIFPSESYKLYFLSVYVKIKNLKENQKNKMSKLLIEMHLNICLIAVQMNERIDRLNKTID